MKKSDIYLPRAPPRILYHGTTTNFISNYFSRIPEQEWKFYQWILTESLKYSVASAYKKAAFDESAGIVLIIDPKKLDFLENRGTAELVYIPYS